MKSAAFKNITIYYAFSYFTQVLMQMKSISVCIKLFFRKLEESPVLPMHQCFCSQFDFISVWILVGNSEITNLLQDCCQVKFTFEKFAGILLNFFFFLCSLGVLALVDVKSVICESC